MSHLDILLCCRSHKRYQFWSGGPPAGMQGWSLGYRWQAGIVKVSGWKASWEDDEAGLLNRSYAWIWVLKIRVSKLTKLLNWKLIVGDLMLCFFASSVCINFIFPPFSSSFYFFFNWRLIALQCCVSFCHTTTQISHDLSAILCAILFTNTHLP